MVSNWDGGINIVLERCSTFVMLFNITDVNEEH